MKYKIECEKDYRDFLDGKIRRKADELGLGIFCATIDFLSQYPSTEELEKYYESMKEEEEGD